MIAVSYFERIESARAASDIFDDADKARATYRRLAKVVHPDVNQDDKTRAEKAFARLTQLWDEFNGKAPGNHPLHATHTIYETKRNTYALHDLIAKGDIANVYSVSYVPDEYSSAVKIGALKMPRDPKNNDLIANEISALKRLKEEVPAEQQMYHPTTVDTFQQRDSTTGKQRRAIITEQLTGFVTLREVLQAYPTGIDGRHIAWIGRRLWVALELAHEAGLAHTAVFPEHVMIHPTMHGVVLLDWCYSKERGEKLTHVTPDYMHYGWYGSNYDKPLDHRLDVRQASQTLELLIGDGSLRPFRAFFNGCRVASTPSAGQLFEEFDQLLERLYGKRKYVPFEMPKGWKR